MADAIAALRDILATNWSKAPEPTIEDIADLDRGDAKRVRMLDTDVIRIFETAHNEAQPELLYDYVNEHVNITIDCRTVDSRERLSEIRDEVRRIIYAFRKGDGKNFDRIIYKTRTDLSDRSKKLFRYTIQCEVVTFSTLATSADPVVNPATGDVSGGNTFQTYDGDLTTLAAMTPSDSVFIVGNGANWVAESGATARTSLGLGTIATQDSDDVSITGGSINGVAIGTSTTGVVYSITAGTGITANQAAGAVTLNVGGLTVSELAANSIQLSSESFADNDTSLMTSAAIQDKILSYGFTTEVGDITAVTAGTGLSGGGSSGDVTVSLDLKDEDNMASNSATHAASQQSIKAYVDTEVSGLVDSAPGALDTLNELAAAINDDASFSSTMTTALGNRVRADASQTFSASEQLQARTNIGLSAASVPTAGTGIDISGSEFSVDVSDFMGSGANNRVLTATGTDAFQGEATLTYDGTTLTIDNGGDEVIALGSGSGLATMEMGGDSGARIDLKSPNSDDYDIRIHTTGTGGEIVTASPLTFKTSNNNDDITFVPHGTGKVKFGSGGTEFTLPIERGTNGQVLKTGSNGVVAWGTDNNDDHTYAISSATVSGGANLVLTAGGSGSGTDTVKFTGGTNTTISQSSDEITVASSDTTYSTTVVDSSDDALIRLTAGGSGSGNDDIKLVAGTNVTLTPDAGTSPPQITITASTQGDITGITAGTGLSGGGSDGDVTLNVDVSEFSAVTPASGDSFLTLDSDGSTEQRTTVDALATLLAGTNISASNGVLSSTNTQTTYAPSVVDSSNDALIRLTAGGAGSGTQDIKLVAGSNITLTPDTSTSPHQITIAAPPSANDATITLTAGTGLSGGGNFTTDQSSGETITFNVDTNTMATKTYVDSVKQGLDTKDSVRAATDGDNINNLNGTMSIDGVSLQDGDRVLVKDQDDGEDNGIYVVQSGQNWVRASDADANADVTAGLYVWVEEGSSNADSGWILTTNGSITVGTTSLTFTQFSGAGQITAGTGLTKSGNTLNVGGLTVARFAGSAIQTSSEVSSFANNDTSLLTAAGIKNYIEANSFGFLTSLNGITVSNLAAGSIQLSSESFSDDDTSLMTSAAIQDKILAYGYTTNTGDITGVDLTVTSPITIASETNTTSGSYSATLGLDDPANLSQLTESTDATDDKILLWDESASAWKYMTIDDLQDSIDTGGGGGIAFDGSTVNGVLTYKDADEATVESNMTFDGNTFKLGLFTSTTDIGSDSPSEQNSGTGAADAQLRIAGRAVDQPGIIQLAHFDGNNFYGGTNEFVLGKIQFAMNENSNAVTTVAEIRGNTSDPNDPGHFDGALQFWTSQGDASGANLTEKMTITADGNVGIGVTPAVYSNNATTLQVHDATIAELRLTTDETGSATGNGSLIQAARAESTDNLYIWNKEAGKTIFATSGVERARIDASGNVGIGTNSPASLLHVGSTAYELSSGAYLTSNHQRTAKMVIHADDANTDWDEQEIGLALHNEDPTANNWSPHIAFTTHEDDDGSPANANPVAVAAISATYNTRVANGWAKGDLAFFTNNAGSGNAERMRITSAGNLALKNGTAATPASDVVHLTQDGDALRVDTEHGYVKLGPTNTSWSHITTDRAKFYISKPIVIDGGSTSGGAYNISSYSTEDLVLATGSGADDRLTIKADTGNIGIGETAPLFPLHLKYTDNRTDPEGSGSSSGAGAIGANAQGGGLFIENLSTTDGSWAGVTFRTDTADARIAYKSVGSSLSNEAQMSFYLDTNDSPNQLTLEEVLRLRGGASGGNQTFNSVDLPTNDARLRLGASQQLELKFDGSHTRITHDAATDSWMIFKNTDGAGFQFNIGSDKGIEINKDGNVELYYDNSKKIETTSAGATVTGTLTATVTNVTVSDSTANTNFPVVFHDESNALLDDTGALRYNPSTGTLLVPNLNVAGTTTQVNTVTMEAQNAIVFEGATADAYETTLTITDPTADRTITLPNETGTVALTSDLINFDGSTANGVLTYKDADEMSVESTLTYDPSGQLAITSSGYGRIEMQGDSGAYIDMKNSTSDDFDVRLITTGGGLDVITAGGSAPIQLKTNGTTRVKIEDAQTTMSHHISFGTTSNPYIKAGTGGPLAIRGDEDGLATSYSSNTPTYSTAAALQFRVNASNQTAMEIQNNKDIKTYGFLKSGSHGDVYGANTFIMGVTGSTADNDWFEVFRWTPKTDGGSDDENWRYDNFQATFQVTARGIGRSNFNLHVRGEYGVQDSNGWWTKEFIIDGWDDNVADSDTTFRMVYNAGTGGSTPYASLYQKRDEDWEYRQIKLIQCFTNCYFDYLNTNVGETDPTHDTNTGSANLDPSIRRKLYVDANEQLIHGVAATGIYLDNEDQELLIKTDTDPLVRAWDTTDNYAATLQAHSSGAWVALGDMDSSDTSWMKFGAFSGTNNLDTKTRDFHIYGSNTTTGFYFDESAGRFGIGTTSPVAPLTVETATNDVEALRVQNSAGNPGGVQGITRLGISSRLESVAGAQIIAKEMDVADYRTNMIFATKGTNVSDDPVSERMFIKYDGNVGIGTTSPMNTLQVNHSPGDGNQGIIIVREDATVVANEVLGGIGFDSTDGNVPSSVLEASAAIAAYAAEGHGTGDKGGYLTFLTSAIDDDDDTTSHERMRIASDGKVGIGTTSPDTTLHIAGSSHRMLTLERQDANAGYWSGIEFQLGDSASDTAGHVYGIIGGAVEDNTNGAEDGALIFHTSLAGTTAEKMRITSAGNVGIGTSSPGALLHVSGNQQIWDGTNEAHLILRRNATGANYGSAIKWQFGDSANAASGHEYARITGNIQDSTDGSEDGYMTFQTSRDGTLTEAIRIRKDGHVGIGTSSPLTTLHLSDADEVTLSVDSSNSIGSQISLDATATGGDEWRLISAADGAGTDDGTGAFGLYNVDAGAYRFVVHGDTGYTGIGTSSPDTTLHVVHAVTDPSVYSTPGYGVYIDSNLSGSGATGGDRHQGGLYVDVDSTTTGGDTSDEHRIYGIYADVRQNTAGDSDNLYGVYSYVESQRSGNPTTTTSNVRALYGVAASDENSNCTIGTMHGVYGYSTLQDAGTVSATYGGFSYVNVHSNRSVDTNNIRGHGVEVDIAGGRSGGNIDINFVRLYEAIFDHNVNSSESTATVANAYLFYGDYNVNESSEITTKWGIYEVDADKNYFSAPIGINDTTPSGDLDITGAGGGNGDITVKRTSGASVNIQAQASAGIIGTSTNHNFQIKTNGSVRMTVETGGDVGIGTTNPVRPLHVMGDIYAQGGDILLSRGNYYLQDASDGTKRGSFTSDGVWAWENVNVGIGTTTPNQILTLEGTMSLKEQASANADTAAYGQLWVKNSTPNELYFTTDAGDDIQLTSGTSASASGSIDTDANLASNPEWTVTSTSGIGLHLVRNQSSSNMDNDFIRIRDDSVYTDQSSLYVLHDGGDQNNQQDFGRSFAVGAQSTGAGTTFPLQVINGKNTNTSSDYAGVGIKFKLSGWGTTDEGRKFSSIAVVSQSAWSMKHKMVFKVYGSLSAGQDVSTAMVIKNDLEIDGNFNDTSDRSLKTNVKTIPSGLEMVEQLNPVTFNWDVEENNQPSAGFIAQEVEEVLPDLVRGEEGEKTIKTAGLVGYLAKAVQELSEKVKELEAKLEEK